MRICSFVPGPRPVDGLEVPAEIPSGTFSDRFDDAVVRELGGSSLPAGRLS